MRRLVAVLASLLLSASAQAQISHSVVLPPGGPAGGDLSGTYPNPSVASFSGWAPSLAITAGGLALSAAGTGYVPGEVITLTGGTFTTAAKVVVTNTQVVSATVNAGGSGGTNGTQTVTGTTGTGTPFQASVTVSGGAITAVVSITVAGNYTVNPTTIGQEPVTGASLSGAKLAVVMGALDGQLQAQGGVYSIAATSPMSQGSSSGSGTGSTWTVVFAPIASTVSMVGLNSAAWGGNTVLGFTAGNAITTAPELGLYGAYAGLSLTTGGFNTAIGHRAMGAETTGSSNVAVGVDAMRDTVAINNSVAVGANTSRDWSTNTNTVMIGFNAGKGKSDGTTTGTNNLGVGYLALLGTGATTATGNVAIGNSVLSSASLTTGSNNTGVGQAALTAVTTGFSNVAIGNSALTAVTVSAGSTAVGINALSTANANDNTALGQNAGLKVTGSQNVILGSKAVGGGTGGASANNLVAGYNAGNAITSGSSNTLLGAAVGSATLTTGSNNVLIGTNNSCDTAAAGTSNTIQLCAGSTAVISVTGAGTPSTSTTTIAGGLTVTGTFTGGATGANPTASATGNAINGSAATFMRSDAAPAFGTIVTGVWNSTKIGLAYGGTNADLSGTGGTNFYLKQNSVGGTITSAQPAVSQMSDYTAPATWTPSDQSGASLTFSGVSAQYTVIGNMVFAYTQLTYPATADASAAVIGGLPVNTANANYARQCSLGVSTASTLVHLVPSPNSANIALNTSSGAGVTNLQMSGATVIFICIYPRA